MRISTAMRKPPQLSLQAKALNILKNRYARSPANIFVPGSGYLQTLDNKLTYSNDLSNAAWTLEYTASKSGSNILTPAVGDCVLHGTTVAAGSHTLAAQLSGSGTCTLFAYNETDHIHGETQVTLTSTPTIFAANITSTAANTFYYIGRRTGDTATSITFGGAGLFAGTYTAQQVAALGIPWTLGTASVSLSLGPELVTNGGFDVDASWTKGAGWTISGGAAVLTAANGILSQSLIITAGRTYQVSVDTGLSYQLRLGGVNLGYYTGNKTLFVVAAGGLFEFVPNGVQTGAIDNISVREILSVACPVYTDAHVYLPGSTVTTYGVELVTSGQISLSAAQSLAITGSTIVSGKQYAVNIPTGTQLAIPSGYTVTGNGAVQVVTANASGWATIYSSGGVSNFTPTIREVITTSSVTSGLLSNNYTLSDGSTGYSAVDGTAGLVLDGAGSVGAERITGGTFGSAGDWGLGSGWSVSGNLGVFAGTSAFSQLINTAAVVAIGSTNLLTFTVASAGANVTSVRIVLGGSFSVSRAISGPGTYSVYAVNLGTSTSVAIQSLGGSAGAADAFSLSYLSCKTVTGIHATQATTANKPAVRRGLYNVLKQSNTFTEANWLKTNIVPTAGVSDPFGGTAATTLTATAASGEIYQTAADAGKPYTSGIYIRRRTGSGTVSIRNAANTAWINLSLTSAWQFLVNDSGTTVSNWYLDLMIWTSGDAVDVYGAIVSPGTLTASQILAEGGIPLTTSTAASNSGAGRYSWQFDGVNDSLDLSSIPFQLNDDFLVVAGVMFNAPSSWSVIFSLSGATTTPRIEFYCDNANGFVKAYLRGDAGVNVNPGGAVDVRGTSVVATLWKVGTNVYVRVNGVQVATASVSTLGAMTLTGASIGRLFNGTDYMEGGIGQVVPVKGTVSDADLLTLERWVASQTPNGPTF